MTTMAIDAPLANDRRFFRNLITAMAVILVAGFVVQLAMGRSSFGAPQIVHIHAIAFMGWVSITLAQVWLAAPAATWRPTASWAISPSPGRSAS